MASGGKGHTRDPTGVLRESDKAEATEGVPYLDLQWEHMEAVNTTTPEPVHAAPHTGVVAIPGDAWRGPVSHSSCHLWMKTEACSGSSN